MAGTEGCIARRWNGSRGGWRCVPGNGGVVGSVGAFCWCWCSGPPSCGVDSAESESSCGAGAETDSDGAKSESPGAPRARGCRAAATDFDGVMLESSDGSGAGLSLVLGPWKEALPAVTPCAVSGRWPACSPRLCLWQRALVAPAVSVPPETGGKRSARKAQCAEAGSDSFDSLFVPCEEHVTRSDRITSYCIRQNLGCTPLACSTARSSQNSLARGSGVHYAMQRVIRSGRDSENSSNSGGRTQKHGDVASVNLAEQRH